VRDRTKLFFGDLRSTCQKLSQFVTIIVVMLGHSKWGKKLEVSTDGVLWTHNEKVWSACRWDWRVTFPMKINLNWISVCLTDNVYCFPFTQVSGLVFLGYSMNFLVPHPFNFDNFPGMPITCCFMQYVTRRKYVHSVTVLVHSLYCV
jgi:hypothetical protein